MKMIRTIVTMGAPLAALLSAVVVCMAAAPAGRYQISGTTVTDTKTGLQWQQAVSSQTYLSPAAATYCASLGAGWRVPTVKELATIIDFSVASPGPTVDGTAFPNTPTIQWYQSATALSSSDVWAVSFQDGTICDNCGGCGSSACLVRCVR